MSRTEGRLNYAMVRKGVMKWNEIAGKWIVLSGNNYREWMVRDYRQKPMPILEVWAFGPCPPLNNGVSPVVKRNMKSPHPM